MEENSSIESTLVDDALLALEVEYERDLKSGGQKLVRQVRRKGLTLVMKVIGLGASTPDALRRAEREVELLSSLDSDHVVRVASGLVELGDPVMGAAWLEEYLDGADLADLLGEKEWTWAETARMAYEVSLGLGAAHIVGVVHRDLSPHNVRRLSSGSYKVMDFGFARHTLRSGITVGGQPGTLGFCSPEHVHSYSGGPTAASDVFVVGVLMYTALTGALPISCDEGEDAYLHKLLEVDIPDIRTLRPDLPQDVCAIIRKCLHPQPARRFRNGTKLAAALENTV